MSESRDGHSRAVEPVVVIKRDQVRLATRASQPKKSEEGPAVQFRKRDGMVRVIHVTCPCGQRTDIECLYDEDEATTDEC